jgi:hypothetical protein
LKKMEQVRAAALAPAEPSSQDLKVAAEASQKATEARSEIAKGQAEGFSTEQISVEGVSTESANNVSGNGTIAQPETSPGTVGDAVLEAQSRFSDTTTSQGLGANESDFMQARIGRIQSAYLQAYTPSREGLSLQA